MLVPFGNLVFGFPVFSVIAFNPEMIARGYEATVTEGASLLCANYIDSIFRRPSNFGYSIKMLKLELEKIQSLKRFITSSSAEPGDKDWERKIHDGRMGAKNPTEEQQPDREVDP
jgi:hypothetical protein